MGRPCASRSLAFSIALASSSSSTVASLLLCAALGAYISSGAMLTSRITGWSTSSSVGEHFSTRKTWGSDPTVTWSPLST